MDELIATYGEKKANQITKYQYYWDKYIELRKSVDETKKSLKEIQEEKILLTTLNGQCLEITKN